MLNTEPEIEVLISENEIGRHVGEIAARVDAAYAGSADVVGLVLLEGARPFAHDLAAAMQVPLELQMLKVSSYEGTSSTGCVEILGEISDSIRGRDVLVIDDIYDTGRTLAKLLEAVGEFGPRSVRTCVLLEKRHEHQVPVTLDFVGPLVPNVFVVGYGLDYEQDYRELPYVGKLNVI